MKRGMSKHRQKHKPAFKCKPPAQSSPVFDGELTLLAIGSKHGARRRADLVRQYLEVHFHLRHSDVGIVPLLNISPHGSGRDSWDGAAIMLLKVSSKK
jgi:hypothetical protein